MNTNKIAYINKAMELQNINAVLILEDCGILKMFFNVDTEKYGDGSIYVRGADFETLCNRLSFFESNNDTNEILGTFLLREHNGEPGWEWPDFLEATKEDAKRINEDAKKSIEVIKEPIKIIQQARGIKDFKEFIEKNIDKYDSIVSSLPFSSNFSVEVYANESEVYCTYFEFSVLESTKEIIKKIEKYDAYEWAYQTYEESGKKYELKKFFKWGEDIDKKLNRLAATIIYMID